MTLRGRTLLVGIVCAWFALAAPQAMAQSSTPGATTGSASQLPNPPTPAIGDTLRMAPATAVESLLVAPPTGPGEVWSLARCIQTALKQNSDVVAARAATQRASGSALSGWAGIIPSLNTDASYGQNRPAQNPTDTQVAISDPVTGKPTVASGVLNKSESKGYGATLSSNIIDMPSILGKSKLDKLHGAAQSDENETRNSVVFQVKSQYFEYLKADRLAIVARETEKLARDEETRAEALFTVGTVARGDVLKAKARRASTQADRLQAENQVHIEEGKLKQLLGIPASSAIVVEPMADTGIVIPDSAQAIQQALTARPRIAAARQAESAAHSGVSGAQSQRLPSISGSLGLRYTDSDVTYNDITITGNSSPPGDITVSRTNRDWEGEVRATLPIFTGGAIEGDVRQAKADLLAAQANYRQRELDVAVEVQQAWLTLRESVQRIEVAREGLVSAEEDYKFSKGRYDLGAGTYLDLLTAEVGLASARTTLVQAVADARVAEAGLEFAIGAKQY